MNLINLLNSFYQYSGKNSGFTACFFVSQKLPAGKGFFDVSKNKCTKTYLKNKY